MNCAIVESNTVDSRTIFLSGTIKHFIFILIIKPTRCTTLSNLFWNRTVHVSESSSVHHQESSTVHTAIVYVIQVCWQLSSCQQNCMTYTIAVCTEKISWWWTEKLSKTCRVSFQNKFEKLVNIVGLLYEFITMHGHLKVKLYAQLLETQNPICKAHNNTCTLLNHICGASLQVEESISHGSPPNCYSARDTRQRLYH